MKRIVLLLLIICALVANDVNAHPQRGVRNFYGRTRSKVQKKLHKQSSHWRLEQAEKAKERAELNRWLADWNRQQAEQEKVRREWLKNLKTRKSVTCIGLNGSHISGVHGIDTTNVFLKNNRFEMMNRVLNDMPQVNHTSEQSVVFPAFPLIHRFHNTELLNMLKPTGVSGFAVPTIPILIKSGEAENQQ